MSRWMRQFRLEQRLLWSNPLFALIFLLFSGVVAFLLYHGISTISTNLYRRMFLLSSVGQTLTLGPAILLGILMIRRDLLRPAFEWGRSLPVSTGKVISAKFASGMLYLTLYTLITIGLFGLYSALEGVPAAEYLAHCLHFAGMYEVSYMVTLALAMLLALAIPNRVVYLIGFCAWMFGTFFMEAFIIDQNSWYFLKTFHLNQLFVQNSASVENELWGYRLTMDENLYSKLFVLSFTLLLLAICVLLVNRLRPSAKARTTWMVSGLVLVLTLAAIVPYGNLWATRYGDLNSKYRDESIASFADMKPDIPGLFQVADYDLKLQRQRGDQLDITAVMRIAPKSVEGRSEIKFTLNRAFDLKSAAWNGNAAKADREGDYVTLSLPESSEDVLECTLQYSGRIMDFAARETQSETYYAFARGDEVLLPSYMAWYPLPGQQPLYVKDPGRVQPGMVIVGPSFLPAHFRLEVAGFSKKLYASVLEKSYQKGTQEFEGDQVTELSLFGGELTEIKSSKLPLTIVTSYYNKKEDQELLKALEQRYAYFASWLPDLKPRVKQIIDFKYNGDYLSYREDEMNSESYIDLGLIFGSDLDNSWRAEFWMNELLLGTRSGSYMITDTRKDIRLPLRALFWYVYYRDGEGLSPAKVEQTQRSVLMLGELYRGKEGAPNIGQKLKKQVDEALDQGKARQVKEVLAALYKRGIEIPNTSKYPSAVSHPISYEDWQIEWKRVMGDE